MQHSRRRRASLFQADTGAKTWKQSWQLPQGKGHRRSRQWRMGCCSWIVPRRWGTVAAGGTVPSLSEKQHTDPAGLAVPEIHLATAAGDKTLQICILKSI